METILLRGRHSQKSGMIWRHPPFACYFLRYLRWLRTLPADDREWEAKSVYAAAMRESGLEKYRSYLSLEQAMAAAARADEGDDGELLHLLEDLGS